MFTVHWTGPDSVGDVITLVRADAPPEVIGEERPTRSGKSLTFAAPDETGTWELRYLAAKTRKILGRSPVTVRPRKLEISGPDAAAVGTTITVSWRGPNQPGDFLAIVPRASSDGYADAVTLLGEGSQVDLDVPVSPGTAEIRLMTANRRVLDRRSLLITLPVTALFAPDAVAAGATFEVRWYGPGNPGDAIRVMPRGQRNSDPIHVPVATMPLKVRAPAAPGLAELQYVAGSKALVLARRPLRVVPAE